jgi:hypothetical protein
VNKADGGVIETAEMKFQECASGHTLKDQVRITNVRQLLGMHGANGKIQEYKVNWYEHTGRVGARRIAQYSCGI